MTDKLNQIYAQLWPEPSETELRIMELQDECAHLEQQLFDVAENLPYEVKVLIESYIHERAELELHSITQAFKAGRQIGGYKEYSSRYIK